MDRHNFTFNSILLPVIPDNTMGDQTFRVAVLATPVSLLHDRYDRRYTLLLFINHPPAPCAVLHKQRQVGQDFVVSCQCVLSVFAVGELALWIKTDSAALCVWAL
jgi:hypothetical protein